MALCVQAGCLSCHAANLQKSSGTVQDCWVFAKFLPRRRFQNDLLQCPYHACVSLPFLHGSGAGRKTRPRGLGPRGLLAFRFSEQAFFFVAGVTSSCYFSSLSGGVQLLSPSLAFDVESSPPFCLQAARLSWSNLR